MTSPKPLLILILSALALLALPSLARARELADCGAGEGGASPATGVVASDTAVTVISRVLAGAPGDQLDPDELRKRARAGLDQCAACHDDASMDPYIALDKLPPKEKYGDIADAIYNRRMPMGTGKFKPNKLGDEGLDPAAAGEKARGELLCWLISEGAPDPRPNDKSDAKTKAGRAFVGCDPKPAS